MSSINRDNFDEFWLVQGRSKPRNRFQAIVLEESDGARGQVVDPLLAAIYDHHLHPERIRGALQRLGYEKASAALLDRLPKDERTRKGNFGEVVASEHLRQRHGYAMPVFKLRYSDNAAMPMRGEDVIAFELDRGSTIVAICVGEAKVRQRQSGSEVRDAHKRLESAYHPYPVALSLISSILHDQGKHELADQVDSLMEKLAATKFPRRNWIFIISERGPSDPFEALDEITDVVDNLACVSLRLDNLDSFVNGLFETPLPRLSDGSSQSD